MFRAVVSTFLANRRRHGAGSSPPTATAIVAATAALMVASLLVAPRSAQAHTPAAQGPAPAVGAQPQLPQPMALPGMRQAPAAAAALPSKPADYAYDGAGQLRGVSQVGGESARYDYDNGGNLLSVGRSAAGTLTVSSVAPSRAAPGASVTISGTGFSSTASANTVKFNGTTATVTSASATRLVVTVPAAVTSGAVTVATAAGTATSPQAFTATPATPAPTVTGFTPTTAVAGASVTVSGTGFDTAAGATNVSIGRTRARVTAATATSLTVTVPEAAGSGRITVETADGSATSGTDFVAVPAKVTAGDIGTTAVLAVDGTPSTVSIGTAGKSALVRFTGTKGQRLSLGLTGNTLGDVAVLGFGPYGGAFARTDYDGAYRTSTLLGGLALPPLPTSGTYQFLLDPVTATATGSITATLSSTVTGALSVTGAGTAINLARSGQTAELTLDATAGQTINLGLTGETFSATTLVAEWREPNGTPLFWTEGYTQTYFWLDGGDLDVQAPLTGRYTLLLRSSDATSGSVTVTASLPVDAGTLTAGTPKPVTISRPGQDAKLTFAGTAGQALSLDFSAYTPQFPPYVTVRRPDGSVLAQGDTTGTRFDLPDLPAAGTYTVLISPYSSAGSFTVTLGQRLAGVPITTTGAGVVVSFNQAGQVADLSYAATAGQSLSVAFTNWTLSGSSLVNAEVLDPAGVPVATYQAGPLGTFAFAATTAGTYHIKLSPTGSGTGGVTVTLSQRVAAGALAVGTAKTMTSSRVGQTVAATFAASAGQRFSLLLDPNAYSYSYAVWLQVFKPDGSLLRAAEATSYYVDLDPLPVAGTYTVVVAPYGETGSAALTLVERVDAGATSVGGAAKTLTVASAGRYAETSFTATAGERVSIGFTGYTFANANARLRILNAAGQPVTDLYVGANQGIDVTLPTAGTYRIILGALDLGAGAVTLTLSDQVNGGAVTLNSAKTVTASRAGQSTRYSYAGTAGQTLAVQYGAVTMQWYPYVVVRRPDGTVLSTLPGTATVNIPALPVTGTYEIVISPYSSTGTAVATLTTRTGSLAAARVESDHPARVPAQGRPAAQLAKPARADVVAAPQGATRPKRATAVTTPTGTAPAGERWTPSADNLNGVGWSLGRPAQQPTASTLRAATGTTAVTGRIVTFDGKPLAGVATTIEGVTARTDAQGQFLLAGVKPGRRVLRVDGAPASSPGRVFGLHDIGVDAAAGQTLVLPFPVWLSTLDTEHTVKFSSPTDREISIASPAVPGLEVRLPKGAVIRDVNGKVVTELGITAIPVDRAPFPLPRSQVPSYFTVQPGSAYVFPTGARVIYPNFTHAPPGAGMDFWHYDPAGKGWFIYGHGTVTPDGKRVEPNPGTEVYQFTGAMLITPGYDPPPAKAPVPGGGQRAADPVDLGSGLFVDEHNDLTVDDVVPVNVTRTYQQSDTGRRFFGIGSNSDYDINLYSENRFFECWLLLPDGGRVRYQRVTPGSYGPYDYLNAALVADPTPTRFAGSVLAWNGNGWDLRLRDGTTYVFGDEAPLQAIRDKFGNTVTITRAPAAADTDGVVRAKGPITQVTSPNGKWIRFSYDTSNRITRAEDILGRAVTYTYDASGHLSTVTDANLGVTTYTYDTAGRLKTVKDPRNIVYLTNDYDANGRVTTQTMPSGVYRIAYTTDASNKVTEARLTDPRLQVRRVQFNAKGFTVSDTLAYGTGLAQTTTTTRDPVTNRPTAYVDALNRRTELTYDAYGNVLTFKELVGTANARTTATIVYNGPFDQVSSRTDALGHGVTSTYQANGALRTVTDALNRSVTYDTNEAGQVTKVTDGAGKFSIATYVLGSATAQTDQLGRTVRAFADAAGRVLRVTDPQGNVARSTYDATGNLRTVTDPIGRVTTYEYDGNGNLSRSIDPRTNATSYAYDTSDRLVTVTDPLGHVVTAAYDGNGNVTRVTSARGKVTTTDYDALDRPTLAKFGVSGTSAESQTTYTYDAGNRITTIADSAGGTTTLTPDVFDRTTRVVTPQGQVDYGYDAADRRTTMTVAGQTQVTYAYNNANQPTNVTRGAETVAIGYDTLGRRSSVSLPAGVSQTYGYDDASQLTGLTYKRGSTTLGAITYTYDAVGHPIHVDGSYARVDLPVAYGPAAYDAANQATTVNGVASTYDSDGNLTADGATTYTWNARNELTGTTRTGLSVTYGYDGTGRRTSRGSGGVTTSYVYDGLNTVQEKNGSTVTANSLNGGLDEVFTRTTAAGTRSLLTDALGSTVGLASSTAVDAEYSYQPFGATTVSGTDLGNPTRFTGREDDGNGLYYARARYYSTTSSRFISKDPIGLASGDTNPYTYVFNQPTSFVDPMGTKPKGSCPSNSFAAGTRVLMGDGSTKPIEEISTGDTALAADPVTGERGPRRVTATITGEGQKYLVDIAVHGGANLTATDGHPFWLDDDGRADTPGGRWVDAKELRRGDWLKTSDGRLVRIAGIQARVQHARVYNLTVQGLHTYHVLAGGSSVLVHNTGQYEPECGRYNEWGERLDDDYTLWDMADEYRNLGQYNVVSEARTPSGIIVMAGSYNRVGRGTYHEIANEITPGVRWAGTLAGRGRHWGCGEIGCALGAERMGVPHRNLDYLSLKVAGGRRDLWPASEHGHIINPCQRCVRTIDQTRP